MLLPLEKFGVPASQPKFIAIAATVFRSGHRGGSELNMLFIRHRLEMVVKTGDSSLLRWVNSAGSKCVKVRYWFWVSYHSQVCGFTTQS